MGLFDGIGGSLVSAGASLVGGLLNNNANKNQAQIANQFSAQQSQAQMDFQREMSNTAYQRSTADLEAAGLNPMLAYSQGGASSPAGAAATGQQATMHNVISPAVDAYNNTARQVNETRKNPHEIKKITQETHTSNAQEHATGASENKTLAETNQLYKESIARLDKLTAEIESLRSQAKLNSAVKANTEQNTAINKPEEAASKAPGAEAAARANRYLKPIGTAIGSAKEAIPLLRK